MWKRYLSAQARAAFLSVLGIAAFAHAGGGRILPSEAEPHDYSLKDAAAATAVFNTGTRSVQPDVPFYVLADYVVAGTATVSEGTLLYVPVFYVDDAAPIIPPFPTDINDQDEDADYLDYVGFNFFGGVTAFLIEVDGKTTLLDDCYVRGTYVAAPLPDGSPVGHNYICTAAFLTPLTPGTHTVSVGGIVAGAPETFYSYTVTVTADHDRDHDRDDDDD